MSVRRRLPIGAEPAEGGGVHFRVWAPKARQVEVVLGNGRDVAVPLATEEAGYFSGLVKSAGPGDIYRYRLDGNGLFPDPASRFQPEGPDGPSQVVSSSTYHWQDRDWKGVSLPGQVIYEMHIGTFTPAGTWTAAIEQLPKLAEVGITVLEVMPVAEFMGRFGWGYDGVNMFAPSRLYGLPDDFRQFVDAAHRLGMGVILDVVYNHFGPDGNYIREFSDNYFSTRYPNEWGDAINFDDEHSAPVREFFASNAAYWIDEYHLDGLRLDATQQMFDASREHILVEIGRQVRRAAAGRATIIVTENECQQAKIVRPVEQGGYGLDGLWNDDFHHSAHVALTGRNEAYYSDHRGAPQEFVSAAKWGYLFQGQWYKWQKKRRGTPALDLPPSAFITYLENHDQVANSGRGERMNRLASPGRLRAMTALTLLGPGTPMLFQGEEFGSTKPFFYFADHNPELAKLVRKGRAEFLSQFPSLGLPEVQSQLADPGDRQTFERSKLDWNERERNEPMVRLHQDLLRLRREDAVFRAQRPRGVDGAVLGSQAFVLRYFGESGDDRLLLVNLGRDLHLNPTPEPLLAPPENCRWQLLWTSEDVRYGGCGTPEPDTEDNWRVQGEAAAVLIPVPLAIPPLAPGQNC